MTDKPVALESQIKLEFRSVGFCGGRKTGEPGEKPCAHIVSIFVLCMVQFLLLAHPRGFAIFFFTWRPIPHPRAQRKRQFPTPGHLKTNCTVSQNRRGLVLKNHSMIVN